MKKNVTIFPARIDKGKVEAVTQKKRVAAYARVSKDTLDQENSFESQVQHFNELIARHPDWELVKIYADDGITALNTQKREEFNNMVDDALHGKIDLILSKSLSRFARNTIDALTTIRSLRAKGIPIIFEKENINTMDEQGELLLTLLATFAQQESVSLSGNVRIGLSYKYQRGESSYTYTKSLGYTKNSNGEMVVVPEEAAIVRRIFREYLEGRTEAEIAGELNAEGIPTATGIGTWHSTTIKRMLENERYEGDLLIQKTCTVDIFNKTRKKNDGIVPQYYVRDDHEPIISRNDFMLVQAEIVFRRKAHNGSSGFRKPKFPLSDKIVCGDCGAYYRHYEMRQRDGTKVFLWKCATRIHEGAEACDNNIIKEKEIEEVILSSARKLFDDKENNLLIMKETLQTLGDGISFEEADKKLNEIMDEKIRLVAEHAAPSAIADNERRRENLLVEIAEGRNRRNHVKAAISFLDKEKTPETYDGCIVEKLIETITIFPDSFDITFYGNVKLTIKKDHERWPVAPLKKSRKHDKDTTSEDAL